MCQFREPKCGVSGKSKHAAVVSDNACFGKGVSGLQIPGQIRLVQPGSKNLPKIITNCFDKNAQPY
jgi:hypothetical protein